MGFLYSCSKDPANQTQPDCEKNNTAKFTFINKSNLDIGVYIYNSRYYCGTVRAHSDTVMHLKVISSTMVEFGTMAVAGVSMCGEATRTIQ